jgi:imidazolonepropionase-like amidohydrolase
VGVPAPMVEKALRITDQVSRAMQAALRGNVTFALGTDIGLTSPAEPAHWGGNGHEFAYMFREGLSPLEAFRSGTANGPLTLGPRAPKSGQLRAGFAADVIAVAEDPLKRIEVLGEPDRITNVWKDGRLVVDRTHGG